MPGGSSSTAVIDQATTTVRKMGEYISTGMEIVIDITQDLVEYDKDHSSEKVKEMKDIMLQYCQMEHDMQTFLQAVDQLKHEVQEKGLENVDLEVTLDEKLEELENIPSGGFEKHEKYVDLRQKIEEILQPEDNTAVATAGPSQLAEDEEITMTQAVVSTICPYTRAEMKHPVTNKLCGHSYDRDGILQFIKSRGKKAKCPIGGCTNDKPIEQSHLEDNKELKRIVDKKKRMAAKTKKHSSQK